jgi:hypothetical protein
MLHFGVFPDSLIFFIKYMHVLPIPCKEQSHCCNSVFQSVKVFELLLDLSIFSEYLSDSIIYSRVYFTYRGPRPQSRTGIG